MWRGTYWDEGIGGLPAREEGAGHCLRHAGGNQKSRMLQVIWQQIQIQKNLCQERFEEREFSGES